MYERLGRIELRLDQVSKDVHFIGKSIAKFESTMEAWATNAQRFWSNDWPTLAGQVKDIDHTVDDLRAKDIPAIDRELHGLKIRVAGVSAGISLVVSAVASWAVRHLG